MGKNYSHKLVEDWDQEYPERKAVSGLSQNITDMLSEKLRIKRQKKLYEEIPSVSKFFYSLLNTEKPYGDKVTYEEFYTYLLKYYTGLGYLKLQYLYSILISWITKYYPFSLLYRDRLFHHDNLKVGDLMREIEELAEKEKIYIFVEGGRTVNLMSQLNACFAMKVKNRQKVLKKLENILQKKYETVYIRDEGDEFRILLPAELID